jgi:hypothetical protein
MVAYVQRRPVPCDGRVWSQENGYTVRHRLVRTRPLGTFHTLRRRGGSSRKAQIETELARGTWRDPRPEEMRFEQWAAGWMSSQHDLRATTKIEPRSVVGF